MNHFRRAAICLLTEAARYYILTVLTDIIRLVRFAKTDVKNFPILPREQMDHASRGPGKGEKT